MATAGLVWSLLEKPQVLRHKSCEIVSTLLTSVVYTSEKTMNDQEDLQRFLERCEASGRFSPATLSSRWVMHAVLQVAR